jgi:hypothetical protein
MPASSGDKEARIAYLERKLLEAAETARKALALAKQAREEQAQGQVPPSAPPSGFIGETGAGGIPALSGLTMGSGTITLFDASAAPTLSALGSVTAYNTTSTAVGASKIVQGKYVQGFAIIDVESC